VAAIATTQDEFGKRIYKLEHKSGKFGRWTWSVLVCFFYG
jgi:hypothetical protein